MKRWVIRLLYVLLFFVVELAVGPIFFSHTVRADAPSCFPAGTKVTMADNTTKNIEDVKVGDRALSQNEYGIKSISTVTGVETPIRDNMCTLRFSDGEKLELTREHPMFTPEGWKSINPADTRLENSGIPVTPLVVGDKIAKSDGTYGRVSSIACRAEKVQTYNLILDSTAHTYFAGGYLAHNKTYKVHYDGDCAHLGECWDAYDREYREWTCFPAGTKVLMNDGKQKNIEGVKVGDKVISQSEAGNKSVSTVTSLDQPIREEMCQINFEDGNKLKLTSEHPLLTKNGWKAITPKKEAYADPKLAVTALARGDSIIKSDNTVGTVKSMSCWSEKVQTYNLILDNGVHTYFADGYLAHNKTGEHDGGEAAGCSACSTATNNTGMGFVTSTSLTPMSSTSFTINWTYNSGSCIYGYFVVYIGTDRGQVNRNCDRVDGIHDYRGEGSTLPYGCLASRVLDLSKRSFNTATGETGIAKPGGGTYKFPVTLAPHTIYYVKVVTYSIPNNVYAACGAPASLPFLGSCALTPASTALEVGGTPQQFTTDAYRSEDIYFATDPSATAVSYTPSHWNARTEELESAYLSIAAKNVENGSYPLVTIRKGGRTLFNRRVYTTTDLIGKFSFKVLEEYMPAGTGALQSQVRPADIVFSYSTAPKPFVRNVVTVTHLGPDPDCETHCGPAYWHPIIDSVNILGDDFGVGGRDTVTFGGKNLGSRVVTSATEASTGRTVDKISIHVAALNAAGFSNDSAINAVITNFNISHSGVSVAYGPSSDKPLTQPQNNVANVAYSQSPATGPQFIAIADNATYPNPDTASPYKTSVTGSIVTAPRTHLQSDVRAKGITTPAVCTDTSTINVIAAPITPTPGVTITPTPGTTLPWAQASGGDVNATGILSSLVPPVITPRVFITNGTGGYPGVATYGTVYDFDPDVGKGEDYVSYASATIKNWLLKVPPPAADVDYYQLMFKRFGGEPAAWDFTNTNVDVPQTPLTITQSQMPYKTDMTVPYYVKGGMETSGNWSVPDGKKLIVIVDGNLTIGGNIKKTVTNGTGFISFIVNGHITVNPSVGVAYTSSQPVVEGVYVTSPRGTFDTGSGSLRFVGHGTFIAGDFDLNRDVTVDHNDDASSELFIYDPTNLVTMPDAMKDSPITWQEVAP